MANDTRLTGFADTHIHILPGIDDGPKDMKEAVAMMQMAARDGTAHAVATPHANYQWQFLPARARELRDQLQRQAPAGFAIHIGCELHLSYENVQAALADPRTFALNRSRYLLVEFPEFFDGGALGTVLAQMLGQGIVPVLAHPERNPNFQQREDLLDAYVRMGCRCQVTAASFEGRFGRRAQQSSVALLERGLITAVASDGHSAHQRAPLLADVCAQVAAAAGAETAAALFVGNPTAMLLDRDLVLPPRDPAAKRRRFWARLRSPN